MGVLYEHWRTDLNECFYVGASWTNEDDRPYEMKDRGSDHVKIQNEIKDNGASIEVRLIECSHLSDDELDEFETLQIAYWKDLIGDRLVNKAKGGRVGWGFAWSDEMRDEQSRAMTEFYATKQGKTVLESGIETQRKFWASEEGKKRSEFISQTKKEFYASQEGQAALSSMKKKMAEIKGSPKARQEMRDLKNEHYQTEDGKVTKEKMSESKHAFYGTDNGFNFKKMMCEIRSCVDQETAQKILDFVGRHSDCSRKFDVPYSTVKKIRNRYTWKHLTPSSQKSEIR